MVRSRVTTLWRALQVFLLGVVVGYPLAAFETDQYLAWEHRLEDSTDRFNAFVNQQSTLVLEQINRSDPAGFTCDEIPPRIYRRLYSSILWPRVRRFLTTDTAIDRFPEYPGFRSLQILLQAASRNSEIHDPEAALKSAQQLNDQYRIPPHQELLALAYAANGNYEQATAIQEELLSYTQQHIPTEADRVARTLSYYREGKLPPLDDLIDRTALQAPPFIASATLRDYPTARPY